MVSSPESGESEEGAGKAASSGKRDAANGRKAGPRKRKTGRRLVVAAESASSSSSSESSSESSGDEAAEKAPVKKSVKASEVKAKAEVKTDDIAVGHTVHIEGLVVAVDMNGRTSVVQGRYHDRWVVRVDGKDCNFATKNLRLERVDLGSDWGEGPREKCLGVHVEGKNKKGEAI